jgi:hypothetical protein
MVCYARPASTTAAIVLVVFWLSWRSVGHFFDAAALMVAIAVATGAAAVAAAFAFAAFLSTRLRRAAGGGCVSCRLRCQHAMTEQPRRLVLVSTADRRPASRPGQAGPALLPVIPAPAAGPAGPRWPDRPLYRTGSPAERAPRPAGARARQGA